MKPHPAIASLYAAVRLRRRLFGPMRPSWDARFETLATVLHHYGTRSARMPIEWQRRVMLAPTKRAGARASTRGVRVERVLAGAVSAEWLTPLEGEPTRTVLYLHGGGFSLGSLDTHRAFAARLCLEIQARVLIIDYRLAPEHRFPAQLEDARAACPRCSRHATRATRCPPVRS
jgi:acetyl esterase/lipase